jgi:hypothetical protein
MKTTQEILKGLVILFKLDLLTILKITMSN